MIFPLGFTFSAAEVPVIATLYCLVSWILIIFDLISSHSLESHFYYSLKTAKECSPHTQSSQKRWAEMTDFQLLNCPVSIISSVPGSTLTAGFHPPQFILHPVFLPGKTASLPTGIYAERGASQASHPCCTEDSCDKQGSCVSAAAPGTLSMGLMDFSCTPWGITLICRYT